MEEFEKQPITKNHFNTRGCIQAPSLIHRNDRIFSHGCAKLDAHDWLSNVPGASQDGNYVEVRFKNNRKDYYRLTVDTDLHIGDIVAVESNPGHEIGIVTLTGKVASLQMKRKNIHANRDDFPKVYRKARLSDIEKWIGAVEKEDATMFKSRKIADSLGLKMKINDVEYQGDDTKATFYYTADERVDFRELIKLLAEEFRIRVEMRQIGARQEAARLGGIGTCGRELCCATFLCNFHTVSTNAARIQQLSLNPQKMTGQCGKLKCCLNYENAAYAEAIRDFPPDSLVLKCKSGDATSQKIDVFGRVMYFSYRNDPNNLIALTLEKVRELEKMNKEGRVIEKLEDFAMVVEKKVAFEDVVGQDDLKRFDKKK